MGSSEPREYMGRFSALTAASPFASKAQKGPYVPPVQLPQHRWSLEFLVNLLLQPSHLLQAYGSNIQNASHPIHFTRRVCMTIQCIVLFKNPTYSSYQLQPPVNH